MTATDVVNEYVAIINKLEELRLLLKKKLIQLKVIDSSGLIDGENVTFPKLLTKVNPTDIGSIINKQLPNQPVDLTDDFVTDFKINGSLNSQYSIEDFNSLLIDKFNFYREYLMYQLENMGVNKNEINQAITIKNLILLLNKIDKIKTIDNIVCEDEIIYINQNNVLNVYIYDETDIEVEIGTLEIYENGICIYSENIGEEIIITPTTIGEHTYNFKYVNKNKDTNITIDKYITSELFSITINVTYPPLEGSFTLQNVTTTSKYYTGNEDDFFGYESDKWDIDINITNINQEIPFHIYMYDEEHLVTMGATDSTGHIKLTNINIPYLNSDFISSREFAITRYNPIDEPLNDIVIDDIDELSFIKDPTFVDGNLTYERVTFTKDNYLDDLNGCITNIQYTNNNIQYTTFSTSEHVKMSEITNLDVIIDHFITEIFYKTQNINNIITITELDYETLTNIKYEYEKNIPDYTVLLILKTSLNDSTHPNTELYHDITIYNEPLKIETNLTWYKSDSDIPTHITCVLYDEETNQLLDNLDEIYKLDINGTEYIMESSTYNYEIDINALPYGETDFNVTLYKSDIELLSLNKKITLLSNFELPSQTIYYANDTPNIYYKPKGIVTQNKQVKVNNVTKYTNAEGLIHDIKSDNTIGTYNLTLVASSDNLTEQRTFSYEIKKPFTITRLNYDQYSSVVYQIVFHSDVVNVNDYVTITDKNDNIINYTYTQSIDVQNNVKTFNITINKTSNNVGVNTITVIVNGYTESQTFEFLLYEHLYELITTEIGLGYCQDIQIRCNDPDINTVTVSGVGISRNNSREITKDDDILTVNCAINQAAPNGTTLTMSYDDIVETDIIIIPKGNVTGLLYISDNYDNTNTVNTFSTIEKNDLQLYYRINHSLNDSISFVINDGIDNYSFSRGNGGARLMRFEDTTYTPGTYIATLTFNGDDNFNAFTTSLTYTITADGCMLTLAPLSDFLDTSHTSTTLIATYVDGNSDPISGANIDITTNDIVVGTAPSSLVMYDKKTTDSNGIATFTINSVGLWKAYHKADNTIYSISNESNIRGVVAESNLHIPDYITLESDKNILSYANSEDAHLLATIYDQHGDKIKNQIVNFYKITKDTTLTGDFTSSSIYYGQDAIYNGSLKYNNVGLANKTIHVETQSGTELDTVQTDSSGNFTYTNNTFYPPSALISFSFWGDRQYAESENHKSITINKTKTQIVNLGEVYENQLFYCKGKLIDQFNNPIPNMSISLTRTYDYVTVNNATTNSNGVFTTQGYIRETGYNCSFAGNSGYYSCTNKIYAIPSGAVQLSVTANTIFEIEIPITEMYMYGGARLETSDTIYYTNPTYLFFDDEDFEETKETIDTNTYSTITTRSLTSQSSENVYYQFLKVPDIGSYTLVVGPNNETFDDEKVTYLITATS